MISKFVKDILRRFEGNGQKWSDFLYTLITAINQFSDYHTVLPQTDVRRSDFVVIFFHCTQNWTALNFAVSFRVLIQPYSSRLLNSFCRGGLD